MTSHGDVSQVPVKAVMFIRRNTSVGKSTFCYTEAGEGREGRTVGLHRDVSALTA